MEAGDAGPGLGGLGRRCRLGCADRGRGHAISLPQTAVSAEQHAEPRPQTANVPRTPHTKMCYKTRKISKDGRKLRNSKSQNYLRIFENMN